MGSGRRQPSLTSGVEMEEEQRPGEEMEPWRLPGVEEEEEQRRR
jgi:hypothetical protein